MNKKKLLAISTASAILFFMIPITVLAYLRSQPEKTENKVTILDVQETVTEVFTEPETQQKGLNTFQKEVYVENTGSAPCFVRVYMDFSDSTVKEKSKFSVDGTKFYNWNDFLNNLAPNWTYIPTGNSKPEALQGWFYYTKALSVKDENHLENSITTALLKALQTNYNNNYYDISDFQLIVYSETVQAVNKNGDEVTSWETAWTDFLRVSS